MGTHRVPTAAQAVSLSTWSTKHSNVHTARSLPQFCFPARGLRECKTEVPVNTLPSGHSSVFGETVRADCLVHRISSLGQIPIFCYLYIQSLALFILSC